MATTPAPHARKVKVREATTGRVFETWPVDAREMVAQSDKTYEYVAPESPAPSSSEAQASEGVAGSSTDGAPNGALNAPSDASGAPGDSSSPLVTPKSVTEQLEEKSYPELQALAKKVGMNAFQKKGELVAALVPHIESGALSLEGNVLPTPTINPS